MVFRLTTSTGNGTVISVDRRNDTAWIEGAPHLTSAAYQALQALDLPPENENTQTQLVSIRTAQPEHVRRAASLLEKASQAAGQSSTAVVPLPSKRPSARWGGDLLTMIFQQANQAGENAAQPNVNAQLQPNQPAVGGANQPPNAPPLPGAAAQPGQAAPGAEGEAEGGFIGPVTIEFLENLDTMIIRGHPRDVERVKAIIADILEQARGTAPAIEVVYLKHVNSETLSTLINTIYTAALAPRLGTVNITPLVQPNALLLVGRPDNVAAVVELVNKLDLPIGPESEFEVFMLKHATAAEVELVLRNFYNEGQALPTGVGAAAAAGAAGAQLRPGLGTRLRIVSDYRSNSLIVLASRRDLEEIRRLIAQLDVKKIDSTNEIRVFQLRNSLAEQLAPVLQEAITGQVGGQLGQALQQQAAGGAGQAGRIGQIRSRMLQMITIDQQGNRILESGVLTDVKVVADARANTLIITAPAESMELITALIRTLDELPAAEAQVKVFTIINGDAQSLADMLQELFGQQGQQAGQLAVQATGQGETTLVPLRFAVDPRTNSVIATGSSGDLTVVEAILLRLDESDIQQRRTRVFRLRYAFAVNVADAINELLTQERNILLQQQGVLSPFEQIQREVVVVPEVVTNSLIVSSTPRFYEEVVRIVEDLDRRPPMVVIQVVIAEVTLTDIDEFGAEFGLQDSLLFSRSAGIGTNTLTPGYNFNNQPLGNSGSAESLAARENLAGQALSHFALGRTGSPGYGGLVLSASNESISILLRALQQDGRARILSRPQVMTLDNLGAFIQRGSQVPYSGGQTIGTGGQTAVNTLFANVGLILGVTPRVTPDGLIVMEVDAENSSVSAFIDVGNGGQAPQIDLSRAQTTVSARSGQTVILGGIIATSKIFTSRRIPYLSDVPVLGQLFRFDSQNEERRELLIILTPYVVNNEYEMERVKQVEFARMNWCLADVVAIHGDIGGQSGSVLSECDVIFPDQEPLGVQITPVPEPQYGLPNGVDSTLPLPGAGAGMIPPAPGMAPPGAGPAPVLPRGAPPGAAPTPALPPPDLPLTPPAPMGARPPQDGVRESSRRMEMENAYSPPPGHPPAGQNYPVYPAAYQR
jgi:type II secretion system protein D